MSHDIMRSVWCVPNNTPARCIMIFPVVILLVLLKAAVKWRRTRIYSCNNSYHGNGTSFVILIVMFIVIGERLCGTG